MNAAVPARHPNVSHGARSVVPNGVGWGGGTAPIDDIHHGPRQHDPRAFHRRCRTRAASRPIRSTIWSLLRREFDECILRGRGSAPRGGAGGAASKPWRWPPSNGSIGSTTACSKPSATFRPPKQKRTTMRRSMSPLWWRDANQTASGKPGAVQNSLSLMP